MINIFLTLFVMTISLNVLAADKIEVLRTLDCKGTVTAVDKTTSKLSARIQDTKTTFSESGTTFVEYWSTVTFNDLKKNNDSKLFGNLTSAETSEDIQNHRDAPRDGSWQGLTFYEIFKNKKASENPEDDEGNSTRLGLIVLSSSCTTEQFPEALQCPNPKGTRNYEVAVQFGEQGDKDVLAFGGKLKCVVKSNIAE